MHLNNILKQSSITFLGRGISLGANFLLTVLFTRLLGIDRYGLFVLARTVSFVLALIGSLGFGPTLVKFVSRFNALERNDQTQLLLNYSFTVTLIFSSFLGITLFFLSRYLAIFLFEDKELTIYLVVFAVTIPLQAILHTMYGFYRGMKEIKYRVLVEALILPISQLFLLGILSSFVESNFVAVSISVIGAYTISVFLSITLVKSINNHSVNISIFLKKSIKKNVLSYQFPLLLSSTLDFIMKWVDTLMLGILAMSSVVGEYNIALRITAFVALPLMATNSIFAPIISELYSKRNLAELKVQYKYVTKMIFVFSSFILLIILVGSKYILGLFGVDFKLDSLTLLILGFGQLINVSMGASGQILTMTGSQKLNLYNSLFFLSASITLNYLLIPDYGLFGAALANAFALTLLNITRIVQAYQYLKFTPFSTKYFAIWLICISIFLIDYIFFSLENENIFRILVLPSVFLFSVLTIVLNNHERKLLLKRLNRALNK